MDDKYSVSIMWEDERENDSSNGLHTVAWFIDIRLAQQYARWQYGIYASWATYVRVDVRIGDQHIRSYTTP